VNDTLLFYEGYNCCEGRFLPVESELSSNPRGEPVGVPVRGFVSSAVMDRKLALHRYRSLLASMEATVVSAESDHDAFQCSDSEYFPTARREASCCFTFLYSVLQAKLVTVPEAWSYSVHPSLHGMCCYCFAAPFSFLRTVSTKAE
jgi:hypothetical protein